ncbi:hypothetical protein MA16_Dca009453 [Dendrobium catenatum]|uniref:Uncharacterized protein n=1 Tax=Dendrobium catenatum TaxID=906689 RepID=A0A2I0X508_9ASPA|nr:hypothetical protein MA16_Dca009453 [Dendrobium catenatum]
MIMWGGSLLHIENRNWRETRMMPRRESLTLGSNPKERKNDDSHLSLRKRKLDDLIKGLDRLLLKNFPDLLDYFIDWSAIDCRRIH